MANSETYRRHAIQCLDMARTISDESQRAFLIAMAQDWQKLADQAIANDNLKANPVVEEPDRGD